MTHTQNIIKEINECLEAGINPDIETEHSLFESCSILELTDTHLYFEGYNAVKGKSDEYFIFIKTILNVTSN